ncbi:MAG: hypothetical protein IPJ07_22240 [Acidobacteria bacterium]|nr:hypothetical protein [Acidobacteriota bacterium]
MKRINISSDRLFAVSSKWTDEEPIREELFSIERLEQYAATLATEHAVSEGPQRGRQLLPQFEENGRRLTAAYRTLTEALFDGQGISPAAEWLVDNFHIVEEQLRQIRQDLPKSYYYQLPKLSTGEMRGYPRIYSIAYTFIAHTDSRFDGDSTALYPSLPTGRTTDDRRTMGRGDHAAVSAAGKSQTVDGPRCGGA